VGGKKCELVPKRKKTGAERHATGPNQPEIERRRPHSEDPNRRGEAILSYLKKKAVPQGRVTGTRGKKSKRVNIGGPGKWGEGAPLNGRRPGTSGSYQMDNNRSTMWGDFGALGKTTDTEQLSPARLSRQVLSQG